MRVALSSLVQSALQTLGFPLFPFVLEVPDTAQFGDFSCTVAMQLAKKAQKPPRVLAQEIVDAIPANTLIARTEIAGPGFINFFLSDFFVLDEFFKFSPQNPPKNKNPKKICVEFSSPNIAKPLHVGHLRSTIIGDSIARMLSYCGHEVIRENFLGDWGTGFGKLVVAMEKWGNAQTIAKNPIQELGLLYQRFALESQNDETLDDQAREAFRKLEMENDATIRREWEWIRNVSIEQVEKFYQFLQIPPFDWSAGESFYATKTDEVLKKIEKIGEISEGALVVRFLDTTTEGEPKEKMPLILFRRADGATLYQTRDVAHLLYWEEQHIDEFITVVANEQSLHFNQVFETVARIGCQMKCEHVAFGMVLGADGKKFSTRKGNGVGLEPVFDEAKEKIRGTISSRVNTLSEAEKEKLIESIAVGAIKFNDLCQNRVTDIVFNWEKILSFEGFSGPFLQYSHARAKSILRKADTDFLSFSSRQDAWTQELPLVKKMLSFFHTVELSAQVRRPNVLAEYLFDLCKEFNAFYQNNAILKTENEQIKKRRLLLVSHFADTLKTGLFLLGIDAPEEM